MARCRTGGYWNINIAGQLQPARQGGQPTSQSSMVEAVMSNRSER